MPTDKEWDIYHENVLREIRRDRIQLNQPFSTIVMPYDQELLLWIMRNDREQIYGLVRLLMEQLGKAEGVIDELMSEEVKDGKF